MTDVGDSQARGDGESPKAVADAMRGDPAHRVVGRRQRKVDALSKVTGQAQYADDLVFPGMLFGRLLRCPHPHARIVAVDISAALQDPEVVACITGADLPHPYGVLPVSMDEHGLAPDKGRFVGDPVAAVAATSPAAAAAALERIAVQYEILPAYLTVESALSAAEPVHADPGGRSRAPNLQKGIALEFGDADEAIAAAECVAEDIFHYGGNTHVALEEHACVARPEPDGGVTLWSSTQTPLHVRGALARALALPEHRVRVVVPTVGGGFGGKTEALPHEVAAARLALTTGRPVKFVLDREEVFYSHRGRHPVTMGIRLGAKRDGTLTALDVRTVLDGGAYGSYGVATTYYTGALAPVTYALPAYRFRGARVYTNKPPCGPKRGHGTPQPRFGLEVLLDMLAEDLAMCPLELRLKNATPPFSQTVNHLRVTSSGLQECLRRVAEASDFCARHRRLPFGRGLGLACSAYLSGAALPVTWNDLPHSAVQLVVDRSGQVTAFSGATDIGQGSDSVLAMLVAEVLGLDPLDIRLVTADTGTTPVDLGSYSSRVTFMMGNAAVDAARQLRSSLLEGVARQTGGDAATLRLTEGGVVSGPSGSWGWAEAVRLAEAAGQSLSAWGSYRPPDLAGPYRGSGVGPSPAYSFSACVVETEVDEETGRVQPREVWLAHDGGRALNPQLVEGQIEGGVYMGLGEALMETWNFRHGLLDAVSVLEYKTPTSLDMPRVHSILIETEDPEGPFGAKEAGQGPLLPVPPALANSVYDAVGVRIQEIPITAEKVHRALELQARGHGARFGPRGFPQVPYPPLTRVEPPPAAPAAVRPAAGPV